LFYFRAKVRFPLVRYAMKKVFLMVVIILWLTAASVFAQNVSKKDYKIRATRGNLVVTYARKPHLLKVADKIDAAKITDIDVLFANRKDGFTYLVVDVRGGSRDGQYDRQCGAGTEANLLWIKIDA